MALTTTKPALVIACCTQPEIGLPDRGLAVCLSCGDRLTPGQVRAYGCPHGDVMTEIGGHPYACPVCGIAFCTEALYSLHRQGCEMYGIRDGGRLCDRHNHPHVS